jgi:hypothetical protein
MKNIKIYFHQDLYTPPQPAWQTECGNSARNSASHQTPVA